MTRTHSGAEARHKRRLGFTLIELMVVVIVLAILAATIIPRFQGTADDARRSTTEGNIATLKNALERFGLQMGRYPTTEEGLEALVSDPSGGEANWRGPYIDELIEDPWNRPFQYACPGNDKREYDIMSFGSDGSPGGVGTGADITSWKQKEKG